MVVPAYNEEKNISSCLTALKNQNFPKQNYEVIVVNNASTDRTGEIARKMGVKIIFEPKKGYAFALKRGFKTVAADFIAVTDADTIAPKDWLSNIYQAFKKDKNIVIIGGSSFHKPMIPLAFVAQFVLNFIAGPLLKIFVGYNMAFRKEVYQKVGGVNTRFNFNVDTDLIVRIKKEGKAVFLFNNPIMVSSRHYRGIGGIKYALKGSTNSIFLILFRKTPFFHFGDVRN